MTRILVVDDSALVLSVVRQSLERAGFEVVAVQDPLDLAAAIGRARPDVILLDVDLPGVTTPRIVETLRRFPESRDVPILLHSGRGADELARLAAASGADGFLPKSEAGELVERLSQWMEGAPDGTR